MKTLLIAGGRVLDPASGLDRTCDVAIRGGQIQEIGPDLSRSGVDRIVEAKGLLVTPGLIDPHVHLRQPGQEHKETIASGSAAAVAGGFTSVCCMPNTSPALDTPELVRFVYDAAHREAHCRVFPVAAATRGRAGKEPTEFRQLAQAGAVGFSDDGDVIASAGTMRRVLEGSADAGRCFMQHAQEPSLTDGAAMHAGSVSTRLGLTGWPREAEEMIVERDVRLNRGVGCRYHVQHVSCAGTVDILRQARAQGQTVSGEASPHHLLLTHEACDGYDTNAKMNPPLREQEDLEALRQGVADGVITVLATDHAPHALHEKDRPFEEAPFGIVGLETALGLYHLALVKTGLIGLGRLVALMTSLPAALCGLDALGLGMLRSGGPADVTVIDPNRRWTVDETCFAGKSRNSPFIGREVSVRPVVTVVAGQIRHEDSTG